MLNDLNKINQKKEPVNFDKLSEYSLFAPKTKASLVQDYPELKKNIHLNTLNKNKLLFCWYLGCEGSPAFEAYNSDNENEVKSAMIFAKKKSELKVSDYEFNQWIEIGNLPHDIVKGIQAFNSFKIGVRIRLKKMVESILNNFEKVINVDIDDSSFNIINKDGADTGEKDYDKVKKYVDACISIRNRFGEILEQAEQGFGIAEVKDETEKFEAGQSFIDLKHELTK